MKDYERKEMNLASNNEWENIFILPDLPNYAKDWISIYMTNLR